MLGKATFKLSKDEKVQDKSIQVKQIHVVFQVCNFLKVQKQFKLLPIDKLLLIFLATHHGEYGIFPNQKTIASEIQTSLRYAKERVKYLEDIGLISIRRIKRKNHYNLLLTQDIGEPHITYQPLIEQPIQQLQITSRVNYRSPDRAAVVHTNNALNNPINKKQRAERSLSSVDHSFKPDQERAELCTKLGHHLETTVSKFIALSKASDKRYADPQSGFEIFVYNEKPSQREKPKLSVVENTRPIQANEKEEICGNCKRPRAYCVCHMTKENRENTRKRVDEIMRACKLR